MSRPSILVFPNKEGALKRLLVLSDTAHGGLEKEKLCWDSEGGVRSRSLSQTHIELPALPLAYIESD